MAKGDRITFYPREGHELTVQASQNGRRIEMGNDTIGSVKFMVAKELTRGGTIVRKVMVPATEVVAIEIDQKEIE